MSDKNIVQSYKDSVKYKGDSVSAFFIPVSYSPEVKTAIIKYLEDNGWYTAVIVGNEIIMLRKPDCIDLLEWYDLIFTQEELGVLFAAIQQ